LLLFKKIVDHGEPQSTKNVRRGGAMQFQAFINAVENIVAPEKFVASLQAQRSPHLHKPESI
jgi:hypothetical protein